MKRRPKAVRIFRSFSEQETWDVQYYVNLSPEERQRIARKLRDRYYGANRPDIRGATAPIGLSALIKNKQACGRPKDLEDLKYLREAAKKANRKAATRRRNN